MTRTCASARRDACNRQTDARGGSRKSSLSRGGDQREEIDLRNGMRSRCRLSKQRRDSQSALFWRVSSPYALHCAARKTLPRLPCRSSAGSSHAIGLVWARATGRSHRACCARRSCSIGPALAPEGCQDLHLNCRRRCSLIAQALARAPARTLHRGPYFARKLNFHQERGRPAERREEVDSIACWAPFPAR
jgi:hypothetical protein